MEYEKTTNLLDRTSDNASIFNTEKRIKAYDQSGRIYSSNKEIWFKTSMLNSDLCDYSDAYIIVKGIINVTDPDNDAYNKLASKNNAPFISCISKIDNTLIDNAENLDIVIPMHNLIEYRKNYSKTAGSLWNYDRDEPNSDAEGNINFSIKDSMSFDYKTSITRKLEGNNTEKEVKIAVWLKYLSNFWWKLDIPLTNCETNFILTCSENCVIISEATKDADPDANPAVAAIDNPTNETFKITDTKLYVPVVTLSTEGDNKLLEQLKTGSKITIKWNKYRQKMTNQTKTNNLNYLIDPTFNKFNRSFVLSFENKDDRTSYSPEVQIKDFTVLIDGKRFFDVSVRNKEETYAANIEMNKNND